MNNERFEDYYATLGVARTATVDEIRKAKRDLSKKYHPDLIADETLKEIYGNKLAKINNAADVLLNPQKKYEYDLEWDQHQMRQEQERQRRRRPNYQQHGQQGNQGRARHFYDYETNTTYTEYDQEPYQGRYEQRQQEQTNTRREQSQSRRTTSGRHAKKSSFFGDLKQSAQEVREDEKRRKTSARRAHANVNNYVNRKFGRNRNAAEEILCAISKGTLHICVSTLRELSKLGYIAKDSFPKFVIRNRRFAAMALTGIILFSSFGTDGKETVIPETPTTTITDTVQTPTQNQDDIIVGDNSFVTDNLTGVYQEEEQATQFVAKRYHRVVSGDTLSGLAEQAGCSVETIQRENGLTSTLIRIGDTLVIPYEFSSEDYEYATNVINVPTGVTIREIAQEYDTDAATIIRLNEDSVVQNGGSYFIITDTVNVPNFATPSEIRQAKEADQAYSKRQ